VGWAAVVVASRGLSDWEVAVFVVVLGLRIKKRDGDIIEL